MLCAGNVCGRQDRSHRRDLLTPACYDSGPLQLRLVSFLAPSLPEEWFDLLAGDLGAALGVTVALKFERRISGPLDDSEDPFGRGAAELGFVCAPSFRWWRRDRPGVVELLPLPVPDDPRAGGEPVYFSDVIVSANSDAATVDDLLEARWAFNDTHSLSGFGVVRERLGRDGAVKAQLLHAGSHIASIDAVVRGEADAAAIDSNVLRLRLRAEPALSSSIRVVESWGPRPIQAVVIRSALDRATKCAVAETLLSLHERRQQDLRSFGFERFKRVAEDFYDQAGR
jgi:phosphonate transport system substrate-binding protein